MWRKMKGLGKLDSPLARTGVCTAWAEKSAHRDFHGNLNPCSTSPINNPVFESIETLDLTQKSPFCVFDDCCYLCLLKKPKWVREREREREVMKKPKLWRVRWALLFDNHSFFRDKMVLLIIIAMLA